MRDTQTPIFLAHPYKSYLLVWEEVDGRLCWTDHPGESCDTIAEATNNLDGSVRVIFDTVRTMGRVARAVFPSKWSVSRRGQPDPEQYHRNVVKAALHPWVAEFQVLEQIVKSTYGVQLPPKANVNDMVKLVPGARQSGTTHRKVQALVKKLFVEGGVYPGFPDSDSDADKLVDKLATTIIEQHWFENMMNVPIEKAYIHARNLETGEFCVSTWEYLCMLHPKTCEIPVHAANALIIELNEKYWYQAELSRWCPDGECTALAFDPSNGSINRIVVKDVYHDDGTTAFELAKLPYQFEVGDRLHLLPNKPQDPKTFANRKIHKTISLP